MTLNYLDFDIEIGRGDGRTYPLAVINSPAGNARADFEFMLGELELKNRLLALQNALLRSGGERRKALSPNEQVVRTFGHELFSTLFQDDLRSLFFESKRLATAQGKYLRVKLRILDPQMAALPWEYLFDARQDEYLCLSHSTPLIRYLEVAQPPRPLTVKPPLCVLGMIASPSDLAPLKVDVEKQRLEQALAGLVAKGLVQLEWLPGQTWRDLHRAMRPNSEQWHIFHFVGHGGFDQTRDEGLLAFANAAGKSDLRTATDVARLLSGQSSLRLALLNACEGAHASETDIFASTAATLVRRGVPAVIAMQYEITDSAAIEFSQNFYEALTEGLPVDAAVTDARRGVSFAINNTLEWGIPVLFMRAPDGVIFEFDEIERAEIGDLVEPSEGQQVDTGDGDGEEKVGEDPSTKLRVQEENVGVGSGSSISGIDSVSGPSKPEHGELEKVSGQEFQALWNAMKDAYTPSTLPQLMRFQLNERLDEIAGGENFSDVVYHLLEWAEHRGRLHELIAKAQANNSGNAMLRQVALEILGEAVEPTRAATPQPPKIELVTPEIIVPQLPKTPIDLDWCHVPAGEFLMGSNEHHDREKPQVSLYLPEFYISKTPVTNLQYKQFVDTQSHRLPSHWKNGQIPQGKENHPVTRVSWHDSVAFCGWANVQLPSEAQWEKAARGTDGHLYPWGDESPKEKLCNFNMNIGDTTSVELYPHGESPYGCLDMAGNVWDWTSSLFSAYPYDPNDGREVQDADGRRTCRGGSFGSNVSDVRCAYRINGYPTSRDGSLGFRILSPGAVEV